MREARIFASISGTLKNQTVDIGDRVKRGQLLAEIDAPLLALEEKQAAVAVKQAKGFVQEAEARCLEARAEVDVGKAIIHEKEAALKGMNAMAQVNAAKAAVDSARADAKVKQSKVTQADAALETARAGLETAELGLEKARYSQSLTRIVAPFDGVVTQRHYLPGDTIRTGDLPGQPPLLTVVQIDNVRVVVNVHEGDVLLTEPGLAVELRNDFLEGVRLTGYKVSRIGVVEDENRQMRVEIDVPNPKGLLRPGMFAQATIHLGKGPAGALGIPRSALIGMGDGNLGVYVIRDGKAHRTPVELSNDRGGDKVAVLSGLKPTDSVVIDPKGLTGDMVPVDIKKEQERK
jgi:RND family efflux transporter MFP subunit